jgi:predicted ATPase/class 3 adenylate cyclase
MMVTLPTGKVTFLFTDIEGSTRLWEQQPDQMHGALARHDHLAAEIIGKHDGFVVKHRGEGDSVFAVFSDPIDAVAAALDLQRAFHTEGWPTQIPLRVRMALHTGDAILRDRDYYGAAVNRCQRLRAAAHGGQVLLSRAVCDPVKDQLPPGVGLRDLGEHRLKDCQQPERLSQLLHPELPGDFPALRSLEAFAHNLPAQLTSFIGREHDMTEVDRLLGTTRLLTVTGSGGCGKTRLALQVAADLVEAYAHGVWLVELAALSDPALVPQTVAAALGVRVEPGHTATATLSDYLRSRSLLLLLDNCEHLLAACAQLADLLLRACPKVRILATSREGLGITGETTHRVPSLSLPDRKRLPAVEELTGFEAVDLFVERATAAMPSFRLNQQNATSVAQVCHQLDGIPLALELVAVRVRSLPVEQIVQRLDDRFRLLAVGSRTALPRQQTLRALIDWSYDLLSEPERVLMQRLSVFMGGWTLAAAEAVAMGDGIEAHEVLDLLTALVDKSLVIYVERNGEARYRLLETIREYGLEILADSGDVAAVRRQHAHVFLALAEQASAAMSADPKGWVARLETEHDNLRMALDWSIERGETDLALRLAGALGEFWLLCGHEEEGRRRLAQVLALADPAHRTEARATALNAAGILSWWQGNNSTARALLEESLAIQREVGHKPGIAASLSGLGDLATFQNDHEQAKALYEEALIIHRELGDRVREAYQLLPLGRISSRQGDYGADRRLIEQSLAIFQALGHRDGLACVLDSLGCTAAVQGDYGAARVLLEESLAICRELGDQRKMAELLDRLGQVAHFGGDYPASRARYEESLAIRRELGDCRSAFAFSLQNLGRLAQAQGDWGTARTLLEESLAIERELGGRRGIATSLSSLGNAAGEQGDHRSARAAYRESVRIWRELGEKGRIIPCLEGLGVLANAQGQPERAVRLLGAAESLRETLGVPSPPWERSAGERRVATARAGLDEAAFAAAWEHGRALSLEQALEEALEGLDR